MIQQALNLEENDSKTDGESDISRLKLLISKGGGEKSYVLDAIITSLKENSNFSKDKYLAIALTGKVA